MFQQTHPKLFGQHSKMGLGQTFTSPCYCSVAFSMFKVLGGYGGINLCIIMVSLGYSYLYNIAQILASPS